MFARLLFPLRHKESSFNKLLMLCNSASFSMHFVRRNEWLNLGAFIDQTIVKKRERRKGHGNLGESQMEDFNIFHGLFASGDYHVVVDKLLALLDLDTLINLSLVDKCCYAFLRPLISARRTSLRHCWLSSSVKSVSTIADLKYPIVVCDDQDLVVVAFDAKIGWSAHVLRAATLSLKFAQCLYRVDKEEFPWTQFIGNCTLSKSFLIITPSTAEHEIHLWNRKDKSLCGPPMVIKQQMSDRYANLTYNNYVIVYRTSLFSVYFANLETNSIAERWTYSVYTGEYVEKTIMKVVKADERGVVVWEKDILGNHSLQLRNYSNRKIFKIDINYFAQDKDDPLKLNDVVGCTEKLFVMDLTNKFGLGVLDVVSYKSGNLIRRFEHGSKPHHGWVVHCRSVAPPKCISSLNLVPFLQYSLCLDLELMQVCKKSHGKDQWPLHVESVAHNSDSIFYTDHTNRNIIKIIRKAIR